MHAVEVNFEGYLKDRGATILFSPNPGRTIKEVRKSMEISQDDLAQLMSLRRETISRIETGSIAPTAAFIKRFAKYASIIKVFRDLNARKDAEKKGDSTLLNPTFMRSHFSLSKTELNSLIAIGHTSYSKTKKKVLRRIGI